MMLEAPSVSYLAALHKTLREWRTSWEPSSQTGNVEVHEHSTIRGTGYTCADYALAYISVLGTVSFTADVDRKMAAACLIGKRGQINVIGHAKLHARHGRPTCAHPEQDTCVHLAPISKPCQRSKRARLENSIHHRTAWKRNYLWSPCTGH